ncbi:MAG: Holliday junction resolvase RuvX [Actinomycetota bacterium]|nr:Holliday junction resolvase RuvX [Actinomycetota bacterium]
MSEPPAARVHAGRVVGIDLGAQRIGIARSDGARTTALPCEVLVRSGDRAADRRRIAALVDELAATVIVVGVPFDLAGKAGPAASAVLAEIADLRADIAVPIEVVDERLSTAEVLARRREGLAARDAARRQGRGGRRGAGRQRPAAARRPVVDDLAATVILQHWLDRQRRGHGDPGERQTPVPSAPMPGARQPGAAGQ